jgi:hypothetical protein
MNWLQVYHAMDQVEPQTHTGALVSVRELRAHLGNPDGFDAMVIKLADLDIVALHHTDGIPRFGTEGLVKDGDQWVIGIARR